MQRGGDSLSFMPAPDDYATAVQPLMKDSPFTAPGFVNRSFASDPEIYCISSGRQEGNIWHSDSCTCLTEQGTAYDLDLPTCVDLRATAHATTRTSRLHSIRT